MKYLLRCTFCVLFSGILISNTSNAQVINFEETWKEFLKNNKVSNISKIAKPEKSSINYPKYCLIYATTNFCSDDITKSEQFMAEIAAFGDKFTTIPGFIGRYQDLEAKISAYHGCDKLWKRYLQKHDVTLNELENIKQARRVCEKGTLAKYTVMEAYTHYCNGNIIKAQDIFENYVLQIVDRTSLKISDVEGLAGEIVVFRKLFKSLKELDPVWKEFVATGETEGFDVEIPEMACNSTPLMKKHVLNGAANICTEGLKYLKMVKDLEPQNQDNIDKDLAAKIVWLEQMAKEYSGDLATLDKAWRQFVPNNTLDMELDFMLEYCDKEAQAKSYLMKGIIEVCGFGKVMLGKVNALESDFKLSFDQTTKDKVQYLEDLIQSKKDDFDSLGTIWTDFLQGGDTIIHEFELQAEYCNIMAQIRSWTVKGHFYYCDQGEHYLKLVDEYETKYDLKYDNDLKCAIQRLRAKVWNCKFIEYSEQARRETHRERQKFGSQSLKMILDELDNSNPDCETTVLYDSMGTVGAKYAITTYICERQSINMSQADYYDKITNWINQKLAKKYSGSGINWKEDFSIYIEGHAGGSRFTGKELDQSLDIPRGTSFLYHSNDEWDKATTDRRITTSLSSNKELAIARAWAAKKELEVLDAPIEIGAFEHPVSADDGEYRLIQIELYIPNLLKDFYSKRVNELIEDAGIGYAPQWCENEHKLN